MRMKNILKMNVSDAFRSVKNIFTAPEKKSYENLSHFFRGGNLSRYDASYEINTKLAIDLYKTITPITTSVDLLSNELSSLEVFTYDKDKKADEYSQEGDIIDFLQRPNPDLAWVEFINALTSFYLASGNAYICATGDITKPPLELLVIHPTDIEIEKGIDGFAQRYRYLPNSANEIVFERLETKNEGFQYVNRTKDKELWHIKFFNPTQDSVKRLYGLSPINAIYYAAYAYLLSEIHNVSTLEKGARLSMLVLLEQALEDGQRQRLIEQFNNNWRGSENAGRIGFVEGIGGATVTQLSQTAKDMDFAGLKSDARTAIYNRYKIPLPLVMNETMKFANVNEAKFMLYRNTILPLADKLFQELSFFLMPRFKLDPRRIVLTYNATTIPVLEFGRVQTAEMLKNTGVLSINELRSILGYESIGDEGDVVYQPSVLIPVGSDQYTQNNPTKPIKAMTSKVRFTELMRQQVDENGKRYHTDEEIEKMAKRNGLN